MGGSDSINFHSELSDEIGSAVVSTYWAESISAFRTNNVQELPIPPASRLTRVSRGRPSRFCESDIESRGGEFDTMLIDDIGARFSTPDVDLVATNTTGRGINSDASQFLLSKCDIDSVS